jgi:predicted ester cyclase
MTPDFYDHDGPDGKPTGVDGDEQMMIAMHRSMPDLRLTIEDMIAEGDRVVCGTSGAGLIERRASRCSFMAS